jgi:hypothetical protein
LDGRSDRWSLKIRDYPEAVSRAPELAVKKTTSIGGCGVDEETLRRIGNSGD